MPGSSLSVPPPGQIRIRIARGGPSCFFILFFIHLSGLTDHDTMRRKLLTTLPLLLALLGSAAASAQTTPAAPPTQTTPSTQPAPAGQAQPAADGAEAIRAYYAEYLNDMLHGGGHRGDTLLREMLTPECYEWFYREVEATDANPLLRAQDTTEDALATLTVEPLGGDWYMVRYRWWRTDTRQIEIPLKAQWIDGRWRIVRITPIDGGNRYGD